MKLPSVLSSFYQKYGITHGDPFKAISAMSAMGSHIENLVDRISDHLRQLGSVIPRRRRPGLSSDHVETAFHNLSLQVPKDLLALYAYCDGTFTYEGEMLGEIQFFRVFIG
jgi:hypothetical protein